MATQREIRTVRRWMLAVAVVACTMSGGQGLPESAKPGGTAADTPVPTELLAALERQKAALSLIYLEFSHSSAGTLSNWDYAVTPHVTAYFDASHVYWQEQIPGATDKREVAYDGEAIWNRSGRRIRKTAIASALDTIQSRYLKWPYLDCAGIYAPSFIPELAAFSSLRPLALEYIDRGYSRKIETVGENIRITFRVQDALARVQSEASGKGPDPAATRTVTLLLDRAHGFAVAEAEEWNALGRRTGQVKCDGWRLHKAAGVWLPDRAVGSYYARPGIFISDVSDKPVHTVTNVLERVEFGRKNISFSFAPSPAGQSHDRRKLFEKADRTSPAEPPAPGVTNEATDRATVERIKAEVIRHSEVMELASWLTDVFGPRLTGSPNTQAAGEWAAAKMRSWGLGNVHVEEWGPFERGWTSERFTFRALTPRIFPIVALPSAWSVSTPGRVTGPAVRFDVQSFADMRRRFSGKLRNAFLLCDAPLTTPAHFEAEATRLSDARLETMTRRQGPASDAVELIEDRYATDGLLHDGAAREWLLSEGAAALLFTAPGDGGTIQLAGAGGTASWKRGSPHELPLVKVSAESYGRLLRLLDKNIPVSLELDMQNKFYEDPQVSNVIAEIPGTDPKLKYEVVMLGAHLDSWTFGTGATDDAAGCAMVMESVRLLKALKLEPRRTIRVALWTGEEQGALGSSAYARRHFAEPLATNPEHRDFSVYFNLDGGAGKIRGVFQSYPSVAPVFRAWMEPFKDDGVKTASPWDVGGGDDLAFSRAGLPSFGFIQDPIEYNTRTHHTSADVYERLQPEDMEFNTAVVAAFAWLAAQRDERLPRDGHAQAP